MRPYNAVFAVLGAVASLGPASAGAQGTEWLRAHIPFSFQAGKAELPPGDYDVRFDAGNPMLVLAGRTGHKAAVMMTLPLDPPQGSDMQPRLVFEEAQGAYTLIEVLDPGDGFGIRVRTATHPREETRRTEVPLQRPGRASASNVP